MTSTYLVVCYYENSSLYTFASLKMFLNGLMASNVSCYDNLTI